MKTGSLNGGKTTQNQKLLEEIKNEIQEEIELEDITEIRVPEGKENSTIDIMKNKDIPDDLINVNFESFKIIEQSLKRNFGVVYKVIHNDTNNTYSMQVISKAYLLRTKQIKYLPIENMMFSKLKHPFIECINYSFQTNKNICFALDYHFPCNLSMYLRTKHIFTEYEAKFYISQLILAIEYLHSLGIIYRDLKLSNINFGKSLNIIDEYGNIKLSNLGIMKQTLGQEPPRIINFYKCTNDFTKQKLLIKKGSKSLDIYGIGILLYELLTG